MHKNYSELHNRLKQARAISGMLQKELAEKAGVTQRQISLYESGLSLPRLKNLEKLAEILNVTTKWLATGDGEGIKHLGYTNQILVTQVPLLEWDDVISFSSGNTLQKHLKFIPSSVEVSDRAFALKIKGDSMISLDHRISFPPETIVIFDQIVGEMGDYVLATLEETNEILFRKIDFEHRSAYLVPLNPAYKVIESPFSVFAMAVQSLNIL